MPEKIFLTEEHIQKVFNEIDQFNVELDTVDYNEELFKGYKRIIIVGPQRRVQLFLLIKTTKSFFPTNACILQVMAGA